jgi:hypothetical protein
MCKALDQQFYTDQSKEDWNRENDRVKIHERRFIVITTGSWNALEYYGLGMIDIFRKKKKRQYPVPSLF